MYQFSSFQVLNALQLSQCLYIFFGAIRSVEPMQRTFYFFISHNIRYSEIVVYIVHYHRIRCLLTFHLQVILGINGKMFHINKHEV